MKAHGDARRMSSTLRGRALGALAAAAVAASGCGHPMPSAEPLGGTERPRVARKVPKQEPKAAAPVAVAAAAAADAGAPAPVEAPAASGSAAPTGEAPKGEVAAAKPADLAGEYRGEDTAVYRVDGLPDRTEHDPNARTLLRAGSGDAMDVVILDSSNGKEICVLGSTVKGNAAAIRPGQTCFEQSSEGASTSATVTSGTATVTGDRLVVEMALDFKLGVGDKNLTGALTYRFEGKRK